MSTPKHTPGPWHILSNPRPNDLHPMVSIAAGEDRRECIVCNSCNPEDAKLIAAAPELLETVNRVVALVNDYEMGVAEREIKWEAAMQIAHSAIAKAEGNQ